MKTGPRLDRLTSDIGKHLNVAYYSASSKGLEAVSNKVKSGPRKGWNGTGASASLQSFLVLFSKRRLSGPDPPDAIVPDKVEQSGTNIRGNDFLLYHIYMLLRSEKIH